MHGVTTIMTEIWTSLLSARINHTRSSAITAMAPLRTPRMKQASPIREAVGVHSSPITITTAIWISTSPVGVGLAQRRTRSITTTAMARSPMLRTLPVSQTHRVVSARLGQITTTMATLISTLRTGLSVMARRMSYTGTMGMALSRIQQRQPV